MKKYTLLTTVVFLFITRFSFSQTPSLINVNNWAYQLQGINITQIAIDNSFELVILDYSIDGTDAGKFTPQEISQIKNSGKKVIAYLSIGEAEDYRYYWQAIWSTNPPAWLGPENPDWPGNYKVNYWDSTWQSIIFNYIDTIVNQGFDGIYLDIIDAYYYWQVENPQQPYADSLMIQFVLNIRNHISAVTTDSLYIIPQNGEDVIVSINVSQSMKAAYFSSINGVGVEDVFFYGNLDEDNAYNPDTYRIQQLQAYQSNGKRIFSIEYLTQQNKILQYIAAAQNENYVPYACVRALDMLCNGIPVAENKKQIPSFTSVTVEVYSNSFIVEIRLPFSVSQPEDGSRIFRDSLLLTVFDVLGNILHERTVNRNLETINLNLESGIYFLQAKSANFIQTHKIIIR